VLVVVACADPPPETPVVPVTYVVLEYELILVIISDIDIAVGPVALTGITVIPLTFKSYWV
jgi:hypothetical protein